MPSRCSELATRWSNTASNLPNGSAACRQPRLLRSRSAIARCRAAIQRCAPGAPACRRPLRPGPSNPARMSARAPVSWRRQRRALRRSGVARLSRYASAASPSTLSCGAPSAPVLLAMRVLTGICSQQADDSTAAAAALNSRRIAAQGIALRLCARLGGRAWPQPSRPTQRGPWASRPRGLKRAPTNERWRC